MRLVGGLAVDRQDSGFRCDLVAGDSDDPHEPVERLLRGRVGADVKVLQRMLGHASTALTLDRYGHLMPGQAESVAERLDVLARAARPVPKAKVAAIDSPRGR
ncbi:MAG: hypothetical protein ACRDWI_09875 [Jiangellaceae bacterium]